MIPEYKIQFNTRSRGLSTSSSEKALESTKASVPSPLDLTINKIYHEDDFENT